MKLSIKIRCIDNDKYKKITLNSFCFFNKNGPNYMFNKYSNKDDFDYINVDTKTIYNINGSNENIINY